MTRVASIAVVAMVLFAAGCGGSDQHLRTSYVWHDSDAVSFLQIARAGGQVTGELYRTDLDNGIDPSTEQAAVSGTIVGNTLSLKLTGDATLTVLGAVVSGDDLRVTYLDPTANVVRSYVATPGGQRSYDCAVSNLGGSGTPMRTC